MTLANFMVIGLQIGKLEGEPPPAMPDSEKPGLFKVKVYNRL